MAGQKAPQRSTDASSSLRLWATRLGLTCSAAVVAEAITYPIDVVKTRLQLQVSSRAFLFAHEQLPLCQKANAVLVFYSCISNVLCCGALDALMWMLVSRCRRLPRP